MHFCGIKSYCSNGLMCKTLLKKEIFFGIQERQIHGLKGIQLLCREINHEIEFITIMMSEALYSRVCVAGRPVVSDPPPGYRFVRGR